MTDEEKAEEYVRNYNFEPDFEGYDKVVYQDVYQAYLDGLAEGRKEAINNCKNKYACVDVKTNAAIPCYQMYDCNNCSKKGGINDRRRN